MTSTHEHVTTTTLRIEHAAESGTLIEGTSRGDGSAEVLKAQGWRWGRSIGQWFLARSRDRLPDRAKIEATRAALVAAGFEIEVSIDAGTRAQGDVERDLAQRGRDRAERLQARAQRHEQASQVARERGDQISQRFAGGQPIIVGHHSEKAARRDQQRMWKLMRKEHDEAASARADERSAAIAGDVDRRRNNPHTVANRIAKLEADVRRVCAMRDRTGHYAVYDEFGDPAWSTKQLAQFDEQEAAMREQLAYWSSVRQAQLAAGTATGFGKGDVSPGDRVCVRGRWYTVARANTKTVSVETGYSWVDRWPWHEVSEVQRTTSASCAIDEEAGRVRLVWPDGQEWIEGRASRWTGQHVWVEVYHRRIVPVQGVWLDASDVHALPD